MFCASQVVLLAFALDTSPAGREELTAQLQERLQAARLTVQQVELFWRGFQGGQDGQDGQSATCADPVIDMPLLFVMSETEQQDHPQLADAAGLLNHAIDQTHWSLQAWQAICAQSVPDSQTLDDELNRVEQARLELDQVATLLTAIP